MRDKTCGDGPRDTGSSPVRSTMVCVLLTATIDPSSLCPFVKNRDVLRRVEEYTECLNWWLKTPFDIVFCENSGYKIDFPATPQLEVIQWKYEDATGLKRGRGYCEGLILEKAYQESKFLKKSNRHVKCSGRYTVSDLSFVSRDAFVVTRIPWDRYWVDSVAYCYDAEFFEYMRPRLVWIHELQRAYFENCLKQAVDAAKADGKKWECIDLGCLGRFGCFSYYKSISSV